MKSLLVAVAMLVLVPTKGLAVSSIVWRPSAVDFGELPIGEARERFMSPINMGDQNSQACGHPTFGGDNIDAFSISYNSCVGKVLVPGQSCTIIVRTQPMSLGLKQATISLGCGMSQPATAQLNVIGRAPPGVVAFSYTGADQYFVVPPGVSWLHFDMWGAGGEFGTADLGGLDCEYQPGGGGGYLGLQYLPVTPGEAITIRVGGAPKNDTDAGWPNGGAGWLDAVKMGRRTYVFGLYGGAGGSSSILRGNTVIAEAGGGNGGLPCTAPLGGGTVRSCTPFGNQRGTNFTSSGEAGGGGWCGGGNNQPSASGALTAYQSGPANGQTAGGEYVSGRSGAGQGGLLYSATDGRVSIRW